MSGGNYIILVDDDVRRRAAVSHRLSENGVHVEPFEGVAELIEGWPQTGLILALDKGNRIGELLGYMGRTGRWLPVVAYAEAPAPRQIVQAILDGAIDYIAWPFDDAELTSTLEDARNRAREMGSAKLREAMARSRIERLSCREREVLSAVASGLSNQLIAKQLGISSRTVESHRANMLTKIGANHISEAIRVAIEASLIH